MSNFKYNSSVSDAEFQQALADLQTAINKKDTAGEWFHWTANTLLLIGKIAVSQMGYGPALELINHLFGGNKEVMKILALLLKEGNKDA